MVRYPRCHDHESPPEPFQPAAPAVRCPPELGGHRSTQRVIPRAAVDALPRPATQRHHHSTAASGVAHRPAHPVGRRCGTLGGVDRTRQGDLTPGGVGEHVMGHDESRHRIWKVLP